MDTDAQTPGGGEGRRQAASGASCTAYDRVAAAFAHQEGDRVPLWAIIENRGVYEHVLGPGNVGDPADVPLEDKLRLHAEVYAALGVDISRAHLWPPARNSQAPTAWKQRTISPEALSTYQPRFPTPAEQAEDVEIRCRQIRINRPASVFMPSLRGVFCAVFEEMGLEAFCYAAADQLGQIERLMDAHMAHQRGMAVRYAGREEVLYAAVCDDLAFKGGLMFSPQWLRRHWRPRIARIIEPFRQRGIPVIFHSDGDVRELIPDIIELGFSGLNPLEPLAGMDLACLKREYGRDLTLIGGVDCSELLPRGSVGQVRDEVRRILEIGAPGGGFIIGDSSEILPCTPVENVLAFYETVHEFAD